MGKPLLLSSSSLLLLLLMWFLSLMFYLLLTFLSLSLLTWAAVSITGDLSARVLVHAPVSIFSEHLIAAAFRA